MFRVRLCLGCPLAVRSLHAFLDVAGVIMVDDCKRICFS